MTDTVTSPTGKVLQYCTTMYTTPEADAGAKHVCIDLDLRYVVYLNASGNHLLTPLAIFDYSEIAKGSSHNTELIDFCIDVRGLVADSLTIEVFHDTHLIYKEANTAEFLPQGKHNWQWDGYGSDGILDTKVLKSEKLKVVFTAIKGAARQVREVKLKNKHNEVDWVDARIDRNAKTAEVTVRPSFSDGGVTGEGTPIPTPQGKTIPGPSRTPYTNLETMAKEGIEYYWSRNGKRANGIGNSVNTPKGAYKVTVKADVNVEPKAGNFPLQERLDLEEGRATSLGGFRCIYHNLGSWTKWGTRHKLTNQQVAATADEDFRYTAAHEFGHFILNGYGGSIFYSWPHKGSSTLVTQNLLNEGDQPVPTKKENDLMKYYDWPTPISDLWNWAVAAEEDVKGLIWLTRIKFSE